MKAALDAIRDFLLKEDMLVYLVVYSRDAFALSEKLFRDVASYIDDNYTLAKNLEQYGVEDKCQLRAAQQSRVLEAQMDYNAGEYAAPVSNEEDALPPAPGSAGPFTMPASSREEESGPLPRKESDSFFSLTIPPISLDELLKQEDKGFSQRLLELIDATGKKDSQIYSKANVSRQHFSKIRNNPQYKPTKATALAFAIALELDMEQTRDLIGRAGYALTKSSKFDLIIMYFIETGNYNIFDINAALFEFDQSLLGA